MDELDQLNLHAANLILQFGLMDYLEKADVLVYLNDATTQLLKNRASYPTKAAALSFFAQYFR
jgi:hypothetical protein